MIALTASTSETIEAAVQRALETAKRSGDLVELDYNGIPLVVEKTSVPNGVVAAYWFEFRANVQAASLESSFAAWRRRRAEQEQIRQNRVQVLRRAMSQAFDDIGATVLWIARFIRTAREADFPVQIVAIELERRGWKAGDCEALDLDEYLDGMVAARYLIGQALPILWEGKVPPALLGDMAEDLIEAMNYDRRRRRPSACDRLTHSDYWFMISDGPDENRRSLPGRRD